MPTKDNLRRIKRLEQARRQQDEPVHPMLETIVRSREEVAELAALTGHRAGDRAPTLSVPQEEIDVEHYSIEAARLIQLLREGKAHVKPRTS